jgi:hypothetical protein
LEATKRVRPTCENKSDFDRLIAFQEGRLPRSDDDELPQRKTIAVTIPTADLGQYTASFNVGFAILSNDGKVETAFCAGSGTLVSVGDQKGILTAAHVLAMLPDSGDTAIALCAEGPSIYRATKLCAAHSNCRSFIVVGFIRGLTECLPRWEITIVHRMGSRQRLAMNKERPPS